MLAVPFGPFLSLFVPFCPFLSLSRPAWAVPAGTTQDSGLFSSPAVLALAAAGISAPGSFPEFFGEERRRGWQSLGLGTKSPNRLLVTSSMSLSRVLGGDGAPPAVSFGVQLSPQGIQHLRLPKNPRILGQEKPQSFGGVKEQTRGLPVPKNGFSWHGWEWP